MIDTGITGSRGGKLLVRESGLGEIGIIEMITPEPVSIYWNPEDHDKIISALNKLKEAV
jgi:hypothetical protein